MKSWGARSGIAAGLLTLAFVGCATSSETRSAPEPAPQSAAPVVAPAPPPAKPEAPKSADKADDAGTDFATLDEAEAALERARTDLNRLALLDRPGGFAEAPAAAAPPAPSRAGRSAGAARDEAPREKKATRPHEAKAAPAESEAAEAAAAKGENPCDTGCKAFASLMRAKAAVCRLDSPGGARCSRAEDIAREAEGRVRSCGCQQ
ncbi:MAG TPA: hypothetical protein VFQ35_04585 [Polyangiaceae bacterium]|nr:hypothetical protein [Polyangiaceae bacterium]